MQHATRWTFEVDEHHFQARVVEASRERPILVDFWADWCPPCLALAPVLDRVMTRLAGRVLLAKVEVDDNMRLAGHYKLRGFPTCLLFVDGEPVAHFSGAKPEHWVREFIEAHTSLSAEATR
jgi:thioredoxin 1